MFTGLYWAASGHTYSVTVEYCRTCVRMTDRIRPPSHFHPACTIWSLASLTQVSAVLNAFLAVSDAVVQCMDIVLVKASMHTSPLSFSGPCATTSFASACLIASNARSVVARALEAARACNRPWTVGQEVALSGVTGPLWR